MTGALLASLEALLAVKQQRLGITRSPHSREVLRREVQMLKQQIHALRAERKS